MTSCRCAQTDRHRDKTTNQVNLYLIRRVLGSLGGNNKHRTDGL